MENIMYYNLCVKANIDSEEKYFYFDYIEDNKIELTSQITNHPLVNGDIIADHMYIDPITESFSGTFSLYGNKKGFEIVTVNNNEEERKEERIGYNYSDSVNTRLAYIENLFERIKNEGIMCTILKRSNTGDESRFKMRENMVLTRISWTEKQASIDFDFTFNEALTASVAEVEYDKDIVDSSLPVLSNPVSSNFTDEFINEADILNATISILQDEKLMEGTFLENLLQFVQTYYTGVAIGAAVAVGAILIAAKVIAVVAGSLIAAGPVGWIVLAAIGAACIVAGAIYGIIQFFRKRNYKIKKFKQYRNASKQEAEYNRFLELIGNIIERCKQLNNSVKAYGFGLNEPQTCFFNINNNGYYFTFNKRNEDSQYGLRIMDFDENQVGDILPNISEKASGNIMEINQTSKLFIVNGINVYLINKKREQLKYQDKPATVEEKEEAEKDLTNYIILVSSLDLTKFKDMLQEIIQAEIIA